MMRITGTFCGAFLLLLAGCGSSAPEPVVNPPVEETYNEVDMKLAAFIVTAEYDSAVKYASNILTSGRPQKTLRAAAYWRDLAMVFMDVEVEERSDLARLKVFDKERWEGISPQLRFKLYGSLLDELNRKLEMNYSIQKEKEKLLKNIAELQKEKHKLEALIQELESVK